MGERISRDEGRRLFGRDAHAYEQARPAYPDRVFELLAERCGRPPGRTLEVGAGPGLATRRLLALGADPVVAVEPDRGFAAALGRLSREFEDRVIPIVSTLEDADLGEGGFDLAVCASSLHWLDPVVGIRKLGACLRPDGWLVAFWNVFGDRERADPFHEATADLLAGLAESPSHPTAAVPFALDREARRRSFAAARADRDFTVEWIRWTLVQSPRDVRALYATFSPIARLPASEREPLLDELAALAGDRFGGEVARPMVTPVYLGRRVENEVPPLDRARNRPS